MEILRAVDELYVSKGNKVSYYDLRKKRLDESTLHALLLGPTGNLRSPTLRRGRALIVGFNQEQYDQVFAQKAH